VLDRLVERARREVAAEGFADDGISIARAADFRFVGQSYELTMPLPDRPLTAEDADTLGERFYDLYERTYGEGTAWKGVPELLLNVSVTVTGHHERTEIETVARAPAAPAAIESGRREVHLPATRRSATIPVYDDARFTAGSRITGPAIIDLSDTTVFVPGRAAAERDAFMNYVITREASL
jgi:N-methylhydantoinase A